MTWEIEYTDEFNVWWQTLTEKEQDALQRGIEQLSQYGPKLGFPHTSKVKQSRHGTMRELRSQAGGEPLRTFYAFDPRRIGILLIGGDKTGDSRFYERMVPQADRIYDEYLREIQEEGLV